MSDQNQLLVFTVEEDGERLDRFLADQLQDASRSEVQRWIKEERATVGGKPAKASLKLVPGDSVTLLRPARVEAHIEAEDIPLDVLYEDERFAGGQQAGRHGDPSRVRSDQRHPG